MATGFVVAIVAISVTIFTFLRHYHDKYMDQAGESIKAPHTYADTAGALPGRFFHYRIFLSPPRL
jgi:hypothetical protein